MGTPGLSQDVALRLSTNTNFRDFLFSLGVVWRVILFAAVVALATACSSKGKEAALPPGSLVLALGDSLTAGAGVAPSETWPTLLATRTGWTIINAGVSGDTSGGALNRLPALLEEHSPALVLVALGGNDMLRRVPQEETVANLDKILVLIKARGAKAVLLATPKPSVTGAVFQHLTAADFYHRVADDQHVPLIEDALADVLSDPQLKVDPLHPNAAGHLKLSKKIFDALKSIGYTG